MTAAAVSRDNHLTLRRVERQQQLVERLCGAGVRLTLQQLADRLGVTTRTIARDLQRLRDCGVPISVVAGRGGGATMERPFNTVALTFQLSEVAALMASLAALGPTATDSAASAMEPAADRRVAATDVSVSPGLACLSRDDLPSSVSRWE